MAVNQSHTENRRGAIIPYGESVLQHCHDVDLSFPQPPEGSSLFSGTKRGTLFLTSHRVIFVTSHSVRDPLFSFMMPFDLMSNCTVEQPIFAANYIKGTIRAAPDGGWDGQATFKLAFRKGGAIRFSQLLQNAASAAARGTPLRNISYWFGSPGLFVVTGQGSVMCNQEMPCPAYNRVLSFYSANLLLEDVIKKAWLPVVLKADPGNLYPVVVYGPQHVRYGAPPAGYGASPAGYGSPPAGYGAPPAGYGTPEAGYGGPPERSEAPPMGYGAPPAGYGAPAAGYGGPPAGYGAPASGYGGPPAGYGAPEAGYGGPPERSEAPPMGYGAPPAGYAALPVGYGAPPAGYGIPPAEYGTPPATNEPPSARYTAGSHNSVAAQPAGHEASLPSTSSSQTHLPSSKI